MGILVAYKGICLQSYTSNDQVDTSETQLETKYGFSSVSDGSFQSN